MPLKVYKKRLFLNLSPVDYKKTNQTSRTPMHVSVGGMVKKEKRLNNGYKCEEKHKDSYVSMFSCPG